jgi:RNA polymerase sigma factor (sigma-70 family)
LETVSISEPRIETDAWYDLTRRIACGDAEAFARFFDAFYDDAMRIAAKTTGRDESVCLDIVQDAMLKAMRGMKPIPNQPQLKCWFRAVLRSAAYDWLRRETRFRRIQRNPSAISERTLATSNFDDEARLVWLEWQLQQLEPGLQQLIHWRYRMGWTLQRIASKLGLRPGAVDGRIRRALERIKALADEEIHD